DVLPIFPALTPKLPVPVVYNCGGYESVETLRQLEGLIDVYLPDYKYSDPALAARLSQAPDYPEVAEAALREMVRQTGPVRMEEDMLTRGVLVRHLILPGQIDNSLGVIDALDRLVWPGEILFSLMAKDPPVAGMTGCLARTITREEYDAVLSYLWLSGIRDGYTQEFQSASAEYIPSWDLAGL